MSLSHLADAFFNRIDRDIGPFDRPIYFHPFPFNAGGNLNFLTVGRESRKFVTYVSWDLFGHPEQKHGSFGRYELLAICNNEDWCLNILTNIGRMTLQVVFEPGDTLDIGPWVQPGEQIQGVVFEEGLRMELFSDNKMEQCGLMQIIGITRSELNFALNNGTRALIEDLKKRDEYPRTTIY